MGKRRAGLVVSLILHGLVMLLPVSVVLVERYEELDLYILTEEKRVIQPQRVVERRIEQKVIEPYKIPLGVKEEVRETIEKKEEPRPEEVRKVEERPVVEKVDHPLRDPVPQVVEVPSVAVTVSVAPSREAVVSEKASPPPKADPMPKAESPEPVSVVKEVGPPVPQDLEFGARDGPRFLKRVMPVYPVMARRMGKEGRVLLRLTIDERGALVSVEVVENGGYGFTEAALEAVQKSTFLPAYRDGKPVACRALLPIRFQLRGD
ncbi:MAG: TonB family protein [Desulfobacterota bacterium]|nr:TonB family protein [Thermodesulfobacteriota bacterium]